MRKSVFTLILFASLAWAAGSSQVTRTINTLDGRATNPNFISNANAVKDASNFNAYANAAGSAPTTMTGGSPTTTCGRITNGTFSNPGSFAMTLSAGTSHQGEGCAWNVTVPTGHGFVGESLQFNFPFTVTGSIVGGDVTLWAYDVTNSVLIQPTCPNAYTSGVVGSIGMMFCYFNVTKAFTNMRIGMFVGRTSTSALTVEVGETELQPLPPGVQGTQASDSQAYTPVVSASWGTTSSLAGQYSTFADKGNLSINVTMGTGTAAVGTISLPPGWVIDNSKLTFTNVPSAIVGFYGSDSTAPSGGAILALSTDTTHLYIGGGFSGAGGSGSDRTVNMSTFQATSAFTINVVNLPLAGKSSAQNIATSQTFNISNVLMNGTRVTGSAPTALGQYRSYLRNAGAATYTETNGTPATLPNAANGIAFYSASTFASADASGNPSKYDIFIGKNKFVKVSWFSSTGKTGSIDTSPFVNGTTDTGVANAYDPTTGVLTLRQNALGDTNESLGVLQGSSVVNATSPIYFDVTVSDNALPVGIDPPESFSGYFDNNCDWTNTAAGPANFSAVGSCTFAQNSGSNMTVTSNGNAPGTGTYTPSVTFTPKHIQSYFVCMNTYEYGTALDNYGLQLTDGTSVIAKQNAIVTTVSRGFELPLCGIYQATSLFAVTLKLQGFAGSGTQNVQAQGSMHTIDVTIFGIGNTSTTNTGGNVVAPNGVKQEFDWYNTGNCTSSPCTAGTGSDTQMTITRTSTGNYISNVSSGVCSTPLICNANGISNGNFLVYCAEQAVPTTTAYTFGCLQGNTVSTFLDSMFTLRCSCYK